jgi:HK97 gp10 family phage protein
MEIIARFEGIADMGKKLDSIALLVSKPIAKHGLEVGGEVVAVEARANIHRHRPGGLADDVVVVTRVYQQNSESYALIGPGWDLENFTRTKRRRGRWAQEAPRADQTTNPGVYGYFVEVGHRAPGSGLQYNLEYQRAAYRAHKEGKVLNARTGSLEFGTLTTPPHPWLGPAFDSKCEEALEACAETMREDLESLQL